MISIDLVTMIGNLAQSLYSVQRLISGFAYVLGLLFIFIGLTKLKRVAEQRVHSSGQEKMYPPIIYLLVGSIFLFLPSAISVVSNTAFGQGNVLTYSNYSPYNIYYSMGLLVRTAGLIWFIRGFVLVVQASQPGTQHGAKGMVFIIAGVMAINFDNTIAAVNSTLNYLTGLTSSISSSLGY